MSEAGDSESVMDDATQLRETSATPQLSVADGGEGIRTQTSWSSGVAVCGDTDAPRVLKQRFVLEERIGSGGMGTVFRARDQRKVEARDTQPFIAVKVLNNDFRQHPEAFVALEREASKSQSLRHRNIVSIFDFDKDGDIPFITMELLEGAELSEMLRAYPGGLPQELAWTVIRGMVEGLQHAHEAGVVHADFKPGNIFVTDRKATKILDFGIARAIRVQEKHYDADEDEDDTHFDPGRLAALTPAYASREMLNGDNPEPRDDLYSLGVVIYMLLSGRHPYGRVPADEAAHEKLRPERLSGLTRRQWQVLERCLRFNRQERPRSVEDVHEALFARPIWQTYGLVAGATVVAAGLFLLTLVERNDISAVKDEVRQETLVETQRSRVALLIKEAGSDAELGETFAENLAKDLAEELAALRLLDPLQARTLTTSLDASVSARVSGAPDMPAAEAIYRTAVSIADLPRARDGLRSRVMAAMAAQIDQPLDAEWPVQAAHLFNVVEELFPASTELELARAEVVDSARARLPAVLDAGQTELAETIWQLLGDEIFDAGEWGKAAGAVGAALAEERSEAAEDAARTRLLTLQNDLDQMLNVSCLRLDMATIGTWLRGRTGSDAGHSGVLRAQAQQRLDTCLTRLASLDPDLAASLAASAHRDAGLRPASRQTRPDPCAPHYLAGNGGQSLGRICADELNGVEARRGPEMVVVNAPGAGQRFAIGKYEVSVQELNEFCADHGGCAHEGGGALEQGTLREQGALREQGTLPVTGLQIDTVVAYAEWLSTHSGYQYRLPTLEEWRIAATDAADPNRNCTVDVGGIRRGDAPVSAASGAANAFGLHNILGNVRELVQAGDGYAATGGGYADPIEACTAQAQVPVHQQADAVTGFRLVREVG